MARFHRGVVAVLAVGVCLVAAPVCAQTAETLDDISQDIDLLRQLQQHNFTADQLKAVVAALQDVNARRAALAEYKQSEAALGPMRTLREALLKGDATTEQEEAVQAVWDKLSELDSAVEDAGTEASKKLAALLTDEQLQQLNEGGDWAYDRADDIFADLDAARGFNEETFNAWRDRTAREAAFRAAGEGEDKAKAIQAKVVAFLDKARQLKEDEYNKQSDDLFEELAGILAEAQPKPIREVAEARAAEQLEYLARSGRLLGVIEAQLKAQGG